VARTSAMAELEDLAKRHRQDACRRNMREY
jgi:hypothetical protein